MLTVRAGQAHGRPEEIAEAVLFLMKNGFVTGVSLTADGEACWSSPPSKSNRQKFSIFMLPSGSCPMESTGVRVYREYGALGGRADPRLSRRLAAAWQAEAGRCAAIKFPFTASMQQFYSDLLQ